MLPNDSLAPFLSWLADHMNLVGWPALCFMLWKGGKLFTAIEIKIQNALDQVNAMSTKDMPTMNTTLKEVHSSIQNQDTYLESMDESLKTMADSFDMGMVSTARRANIRRKRLTGSRKKA